MNRSFLLSIFVLFICPITMAQSIPWWSTESLAGAHDPTIIRDDRGIYTLLITNNMLEIRQSSDMLTWKKVGNVFKAMPAWVQTSLNATIDNIWAPYITYRADKYWVYYCASSFGTNNSVIGVASNPTLDTQSPDYKWTDHGEVIKTGSGNNYNAIDPEIIVDKNNKVWLLFGSFWSGIKIVAIDPATGKRLGSNNTVYAIADRGGAGVEGPSMIEHKGYYYLFTSWDKCCDGINSTYRTMVGRSSSITQDYVDKTNKSLTNNNATELLKGYGRYYGPGGGSPFSDGRRDYYALHYYNGNENGAPRLQIREIIWDDTNWLILGQPFLGRRESFEAEHAVITNAQILTGNDASNKEYVGYINFEDSKVQFYVNALASGTYDLRIRFAAGDGPASHFLKVNGATAIEVKYPQTVNWGQFPQEQTMTQRISLKEGFNSITFTKGTGFAELDRIDLIRSATSQIEGGSYDDFVGSTYVTLGNNVSIQPGGWIMYENIDFDAGGLQNLVLAFENTCTGMFQVNIDGQNASPDFTLSTDESNKILQFSLPVSFQNLTGIHDLYIKQLSGSCQLDYLQFNRNVVTGVEEEASTSKPLVYPNPFQEKLKLQAKGPFHYAIYNQLGKEVLKGTALESIEIKQPFPKGIYYVQIVENNARVHSFKVLKK